MARRTFSPSLNSNARPASPSPLPSTQAPISTIRTRPRQLDDGQDDVDLHGLGDASEVDQGDDRDEDECDERRRDVDELLEVIAPKARARVEADVTPEAIIANATMKVTNGLRKARCT